MTVLEIVALVHERDGLLARIAAIDAALDAAGAATPSVPLPPEPVPDEVPKKKRGLANVAPEIRQALASNAAKQRWRDKKTGLDRMAVDFLELRRWWPMVKPSWQIAMALRVDRGFSLQQVAAELGWSVNSTATAFWQAKRQLRHLRDTGAPTKEVPPAEPIAAAVHEPLPARRRGAPFKGGSVKRMPGGKFRFSFTLRGRNVCGPVVATLEEAEAGRVAGVAAALAPRGEPVEASPPATDPPAEAEDPPEESEPAEPIPVPEIQPGTAFAVAEPFEEEDGTAWIEDDVWIAREPTGVEIDGHRQWRLERDGDGADGVGFPSLHPFVRRSPAHASWDVPQVGMSHGAFPEAADAA